MLIEKKRMANQSEGESLRKLNCPLCLDPFSNATNLSCGHTFCKGCLESYVELRNNSNRIECPLCRKYTKLGEDRVEGLTPNFSIRGLEDVLHERAKVDLSSRYCSLHNHLYNDIFCDDCEEFICLTCFFNDHIGHKIHKYEELERECKERLNSLSETGERRRTHYQEFLDGVENERRDMHCHLNSLEKKIRKSFDDKVAVLQEQKESLLRELEDIGKESDEQIDVCIDHQRELKEKFESSVRELTESRDNVAYADALKALHLHCQNSGYVSKERRILGKALSDVKHEKGKVERAKFFPDEENMLALGRVVKQKAKCLQRSSKTPIRNHPNPLNIVGTVELPSKMCGMAALSQDEVVIGYGDKKDGADCFSVSGEMKPFLDSEVGQVWDITIRTKGRSVISHGKNVCYAYNAKSNMCEGQSAKATCRQYKCKEGAWYVMLCSDQHDNIYAVNYNDEIYIFKENSPKPLRRVPTGNTRPSQICVNKRGVMITSTCDTRPSTVTVFWHGGEARREFTASDLNEYLYAAVDSEDRLLIARVRGDSKVFKLCRYSFISDGFRSREEIFKEHTLPHCLNSDAMDAVSYWCYMVSLTPNRIAFANGTYLYFIDLPTPSLWDKIWPWSWWWM